MILWIQRAVQLLEVAPEIRIFDVCLAQFSLVLVAHVKLLPLWVPDQHLLDLGGAWTDLETVAAHVVIISAKVHVIVSSGVSEQLA